MNPFLLSAIIGGGTSLLGGLLSGAGQNKMSDADRAHQMQMLLAQLNNSGNQAEQGRIDSLTAQGTKDANTIPDRVGWRQNQAVLAAIMPQMRNFSVSAPAGLSSYVPKMSGGVRLPENGFSPDTLKFFGDNAMLQGEMDLDRAGGLAAGGRYATPSYGSIYGTTAARDGQRSIETANKNLKQLDDDRAMWRQTSLLSSLIPRR